MKTIKFVPGRMRALADELEHSHIIDATEELEVEFDRTIGEHQLTGIRKFTVRWIPEPKLEREGCLGCEYCLRPGANGNKFSAQYICNHSRNIQPRVRNFQRQKPLSMGFFPNPPAWCKLEEK